MSEDRAILDLQDRVDELELRLDSQRPSLHARAALLVAVGGALGLILAVSVGAWWLAQDLRSRTVDRWTGSDQAAHEAEAELRDEVLGGRVEILEGRVARLEEHVPLVR